MRWLGATNLVYRVEWTDDLQAWHELASAPTHLGEGLYQWAEPATSTRRFYRVRQL